MRLSPTLRAFLVPLALAVVPFTALGQESKPEMPAVKSPGNAVWASSPDEARERAARESKLVFIEFDRRECGNCQRMDTLLYPAFDFEALLISMVPVKVGLDSAPGRELARRYGVQDAPAILITSPEGRTVFLIQGFTSTQDFYAHVYPDIKAYKAFASKIEAQDIATLPAREALETGGELWRRNDPASAVPRLKRAIVAPGGQAALRDAAREALAAAQLDLGQTGQSRQTINRLIATTKDSRRRERAEIFRAQIPLAENKPAEAYELFTKFLKDHPKTPYREKVEAFLARLTGSAQNP